MRKTTTNSIAKVKNHAAVTIAMAVDIVLFKGERFNLGYEQVLESKLRKLKEVKGRFPELIIVEARDIEEARKAAENKNVDMILGIEGSAKKDSMHFRNSGLNQVVCKLCKMNNIAVAIPIADIINSQKRTVLMGRVMQNIRFCRKYKVRMVAASFAKNKFEQRTPQDLEGLLRTLGMTAKEAAAAMSNVKEILKDKREIIRHGIRLRNT